jgi:hypothetical protein
VGCQPVCIRRGCPSYILEDSPIYAYSNAALGLGDGDDRAFPELVIIPSLEDRSTSLSHVEKLRPVQVKEVAMSKLHTGMPAFFGSFKWKDASYRPLSGSNR